MADDRLLCCRPASMVATRFDKVVSRPSATSRKPFQNSSSRLTLVLWPATTTERLTTEDFMADPLHTATQQTHVNILGSWRPNCDEPWNFLAAVKLCANRRRRMPDCTLFA